MRPHRLPILVFVAALVVLVACTDERLVQPPPPGVTPRVGAPRAPEGVIPGQYIIVLKDDVAEPVEVATQLALSHRLRLRHTYRHAIKGFSAVVPDGQLAAIERHPLVAYVQPNRYVTIHADSAVRWSSAWSGSAALDAPANLVAAAPNPTWVTLQWTDNSTNESGFRVERRLGQFGAFTQIAQLGKNATSMLDQAIATLTEYCYRVVAYNAQGTSDYSNIACVTTPAGGATAPAAPSNLAASSLDETSISLVWTDNAGNENGFKVERREGSGGDYVEIAQLGRNTQSYVSAGLQSSTEYCYRVRAYITGGSHSTYSNESCATTAGLVVPVVAPTGLSATASGEQQIDLAWADNSTDEDGFTIERRPGQTGSFVGIATVGADVVAYSDPGLTAGTEYCYRVRAFRGADQSTYSNVQCATTDAPPPPPPPPPPSSPTGLGAAATASDRIDLTWTDNATDEDGFSLERRLGQTGAFSEVGQSGVDATSFADPGLAASTEYCYRVRAFNAGGYSTYSNIACATTLDPPPPPSSGLVAPSDLKVSAPNTQWVRVRWTDNATNETGYRVERRLGQLGTFAQIAQLGANANGMLDQAIATQTEYCYRVYAYNAQGTSDYSEVACVTTKVGGSTAPAAPSDLLTTPVDDQTIALAWTDNAGNESGFKVERREGVAGTYVEIAQLGPNSRSYTSAGLLASTQYCYRVRAFIAGGSHSEYSNESCAATADPPAPPAAPTAIQATTVDHQRIDVSWTDNADNEDGFRIERREGASEAFLQIAALGPNTTSYADGGLSGETEYCYRVIAFNPQGDGASGESCATTSAPPPPPPPPPPGQCADSGNHDNESGQFDQWDISKVKANQNSTWLATQLEGCEITVHFFGLDTGVDGDHPDLNVVDMRNFVVSEPGNHGEDGHGHGTHTAGTAAAIDGNGGVLGMAPGAPIHGFRVCDDSGVCADDDILAAVDAVTGWKSANPGVPAVANMSLGGTLAAAVDTAIRRSVNFGVVYAVSAGNGLLGACLIPWLAEEQSPARLGDDDITASNGSSGDAKRVNGIITTTSSDRNDHDTNCNYGNPVTVAAPGFDVTSTWLNGGYNTISGTSMAAPHAAGAAMLYLQKHPSATPTQVEAAIVAALEPWVTDDLPNASGRLNVQPLQ